MKPADNCSLKTDNQYKVIKTINQYKEYCNLLEEITMIKKKTKQQQDTIELLTLLIEKWDEEHNTFSDADPVELLAYLMKENKLKAVDLAKELAISKSLVSDILHYRRGLSRDIIRGLASRFKVSQELFNKPYKLISPVNSHLKDASVMNTKKKKTFKSGLSCRSQPRRRRLIGRLKGIGSPGP